MFDGIEVELLGFYVHVKKHLFWDVVSLLKEGTRAEYLSLDEQVGFSRRGRGDKFDH